MNPSALPLSRVALAAWLLAGTAAQAQTPPPAPSASAAPTAMPPGAGPAARPRPPIPPVAEGRTPTTVTGRVARWLPNPNGDVDGLLLDDGTQVAFPPHLSARVVDAVKLHDSVVVTGNGQSPNARTVRAVQIRSLASGKVVADEPALDRPPPPPRGHAALTPMNASGRIAVLLHTGRGDVDGVVLDSGTVVRFPPHAGAQFTSLLKADGTLYAQGYGTRNAQGSALEATQIGATAASAQAVFAAPGGPDAGPGGPEAHRPPPAGARPRPPADGAPPAPPDGTAPPPASAPR